MFKPLENNSKIPGYFIVNKGKNETNPIINSSAIQKSAQSNGSVFNTMSRIKRFVLCATTIDVFKGNGKSGENKLSTEFIGSISRTVLKFLATLLKRTLIQDANSRF